MNSLCTLLPILALSTVAAGGEATPNNCQIRIRMADGSRLPDSVKLQMFIGATRVFDASVKDDGVVAIPRPAPGDYRVQLHGQAPPFITVQHVVVKDGQGCDRDVVMSAGKGGAEPMGTVNVEELKLPERVRTLFSKGFAAFQQGRLDEASRIFEEVVQAAPKLSRAHNVLGVIAVEQHQLPAAREWFRKALDVNYRDNSARLNLIKVEMTLRHFDEASSLFNTYLDQSANTTAEVLLLKTAVDLALRRYNDAIADARKAHALPHESVTTVHINAAKALEALGRPTEAIDEYRLFLDESRQDMQLSRVREQVSAKLQELEFNQSQTIAAARRKLH